MSRFKSTYFSKDIDIFWKSDDIEHSTCGKTPISIDNAIVLSTGGASPQPEATLDETFQAVIARMLNHTDACNTFSTISSFTVLICLSL